MSLNNWALKNSELKPLQRAGLLLLGVRCAMRVEPWMPPQTLALWSRGLRHATASAFSEPESDTSATLRRELSDRGAIASNALISIDEALGRCMNYSTQTLARVLDATGLEYGTPMKKMIIETSKLSASIAGVLAHAGRVAVPHGQDAVDVACVAMWDAIRADIPILAAKTAQFQNAEDPVGALRDCATLWVGGVPNWATTR